MWPVQPAIPTHGRLRAGCRKQRLQSLVYLGLKSPPWLQGPEPSGGAGLGKLSHTALSCLLHVKLQQPAAEMGLCIYIGSVLVLLPTSEDIK